MYLTSLAIISATLIGSISAQTVFYGNFVHSVNVTSLEHATNGVIAVDRSGKIIQVETNASASQAQQIARKYGVSLFPLGNQKFLMPGLIDTHIHAPQYVFTGSGMDLQLLDWLNTFTFPRESRFNNTNYARSAYSKVIDRVIRSGTTAASYYATIHLEASKALADIVASRGQRAFVGKVNMDRNSPDYLIETTAQSLKDTEAFIQYVQGKKNSRVAPIVTPRFVPSCTSELMRGLSALATKYNVPIQSHLDENLDEIAWVKQLHPDQPDYTSVYDSHGLLTNRTIMAHVVYPSDAERQLLKQRDAGISHCPNSNLSLRSGIAKIRQMLSEGQKLGLGTDVSGGYSPSILNNIRNGYFSAIARSFEHPNDKYLKLAEMFYLATLGGADVLGMKSSIGNFVVGKQFDALIIDPLSHGSPIDLFDHDDIKTTFEKFINNGDDRNIIEVFVDGKSIHRL
ncbi:guanine deaminase [Basidiobolus meristosporus CBS 931.73]|uniref:Guanine deaminase n=1 Tax=Basidiobolus meristosporus CBS 931.73 TaxID=1314790 RepID=A0A1Y1X7N1_9FUNG|nr:guanine deaminase [Basidiobolus meristosporus CBS 931.73]|eukprot:ORX81767.1 guanine deaminase [Basidiobolus meristosporus CBS 931.73]